MEDAGNYRDRFAVGNCLNVFSRNCVVSPPRKNKEEQHRITGEELGGRENVRRGRTRRAEEIAKKEKKRRGTKEWMRGRNGKRACKLLAILFRKGCFPVPAFRHSERILAFPLFPVLLSISSVRRRSFVRIMKAGILPPIVPTTQRRPTSFISYGT